MNYTDEQKEHIRHTFDYYCKKTIRYQAISLYQESSKYAERKFPLGIYRTIIFQSAANVYIPRFTISL